MQIAADVEEKAATYARERTQLQSQLDENEEELAEVITRFLLQCTVCFMAVGLNENVAF
jgi:hypothetical protein